MPTEANYYIHNLGATEGDGGNHAPGCMSRRRTRSAFTRSLQIGVSAECSIFASKVHCLSNFDKIPHEALDAIYTSIPPMKQGVFAIDLCPPPRLFRPGRNPNTASCNQPRVPFSKRARSQGATKIRLDGVVGYRVSSRSSAIQGNRMCVPSSTAPDPYYVIPLCS